MQLFQGFTTELPGEERLHIRRKPRITLSYGGVRVAFTDYMFERFVTVLITLFATSASTGPFTRLARQVVRRENVSGKQLASIFVFGGQR